MKWFLSRGGRVEYGITQTSHIVSRWSEHGAGILVEEEESFHVEYF